MALTASRQTLSASRRSCGQRPGGIKPLSIGCSNVRRLTIVAMSQHAVVPRLALTGVVKLIGDKFVERYKNTLIGCGVGAVGVTTWCLANGQSLGTAAAVTATTSLAALAVDEAIQRNCVSMKTEAQLMQVEAPTPQHTFIQLQDADAAQSGAFLPHDV